MIIRLHVTSAKWFSPLAPTARSLTLRARTQSECGRLEGRGGRAEVPVARDGQPPRLRPMVRDARPAVALLTM